MSRGEPFAKRLLRMGCNQTPEADANKKKEEELRILKLNEELQEAKKITVADMIKALSELPPDAKLVITQFGFYQPFINAFKRCSI